MSNYWTDRVVHQNEVMFNSSAAAIEKKLGELYKNTADGIALDIEKLFEKLDKPVEEILINDLYKNNQYYWLLSQINQRLRELGEAEIQILDTELLKMYETTSVMVQNQAGFQVSFEDSAKDVVNKIWCPDGKHWSSRIWTNKAIMQDALEKGLTDCVARGLSKDKVVTELAAMAGNDRHKAERLVRTELTYIQNEAAADTYEKAGITKYQYISATDNRVSKQCKAINGQIFELKNKQIGKNFPPLHANCRCTIVPILEDEEKKPLGKSSSNNQSGKTEKVDKINPEQTKEKIKEYSELIRNKDVEHAYIIDRYGNVFYSIGDKDSVFFENIDLVGATITHNHPIVEDVLSFGSDDFSFLQTNPDIAELIAVNTEFTYTVKVLKMLDEVSYNNYYLEALMQVDPFSGETIDIQHEVFMLLDKEGYVKYERKRNK